MEPTTPNLERLVRAKGLIDEAVGYDTRLLESERRTLVQVRKLLGAVLSKSPFRVEEVAADLLLAAGLSTKRAKPTSWKRNSPDNTRFNETRRTAKVAGGVGR